MLILVLESSTTSAKAMLYDTAHGVVDTLSRSYSPAVSHQKEVGAQNAHEVFSQTASVGRELCQGQKINLVVTSGTWHNILVTDADFSPLTPAFTWSYNGAAGVANRLRSDDAFCNAFYQRTGCMVHAIYPAFKLMMLKEQGFSLANRRLCCQSSYNTYQLTGQAVMSDCSASGSGLVDVHTRNWDTETLNLLDVQAEQLFELTSYHNPLKLSAHGAKQLGLPEGTPVIPSYPDGALNQVGAGALRPGKMTFSVGTSGALRISTTKPALPQKPSTWCYMSPDSWIIGAATSGACNCIDWFKNLFGNGVTYADLEEQDLNVSDAPLFFPFLFGERCPGWQDAWKGGFLSLRPNHTQKDLYHSVQEGVLFNLYQCYQILCQANGAPDEIHLSGGIMNSRKWMQMCADIFGREMHCAHISNVSMVGAAVLGMKALGCIEKLEDYQHQASEILLPNPTMHQLYAQRFTAYKARYEKNIF